MASSLHARLLRRLSEKLSSQIRVVMKPPKPPRIVFMKFILSSTAVWAEEARKGDEADAERRSRGGGGHALGLLALFRR
jgi:hypothetical protein